MMIKSRTRLINEDDANNISVHIYLNIITRAPCQAHLPLPNATLHTLVLPCIHDGRSGVSMNLGKFSNDIQNVRVSLCESHVGRLLAGGFALPASAANATPTPTPIGFRV